MRFAGDDSYTTLVTLIEAVSERDVPGVVEADWLSEGPPREFYFITPVANDWLPSDRFPLKDWAIARVAGDRVPVGKTTAEIKREASRLGRGR